jgi:hypothetical protein
MSGGISAIKGFDYQATVILDRLFDHFDRHGSVAQARPEGLDDLDLCWTEDVTEHRQYIQIKKPTEDLDGNLNPTPWTLSATVADLLPNTIRHLSGNSHRQVWILGDEVDDAVSSLITAGDNAPIVAPKTYWTAVHGLARNDTLGVVKEEQSIRQRLLRWKIPADLPANPVEAQSRLVTEFGNFARSLRARDDVSARYIAKVAELHNCLPGVLAKIEILATFGTEQEVVQRIHDRLTHRYALPQLVIENTLFRNLRGFINDISKQPGRRFNQEELEIELRCVWPQMIPIKDAPPLDSDHVARRDLTERLSTGLTGKAIEAVGISGSGKTTLAAEIVEFLRIANPDRLVYYAEARPDVRLRDLLVGAAFHLRRQGILEPFSITIDSAPTDEEMLARIARSYSILPREILLLIDLVEGTCSTAFARNLATFVRALSSSICRIVVFGQESALRELNALEQSEHGVSRVDIRGFDFEEFVKLVSHYHANPDRALLWEIYHRVTVGRAAGLFAKLAQSLARASSLQEMSDMAAKPAEDILAHAEQMRFARISEGARSAAEKLVCFALPFRREDAEKIFPDENVGAAIRELLTQGLLRLYDRDSFEMHETVRAGLEGIVAPGIRRSAHQALAAWYGGQGLVTAEILHLEKAGKSTEAQMRAREMFLRGEQWAAVSSYVIRHKLVSADEVIRSIAGAQTVEDGYLLTSILRGLGGPAPDEALFRIVREQQERYFSDYRWASAVVEAILEFEPKHLHDLITFSIDKAADETQIESALGWLKVAMLRKGGVVGSKTIEFFNAHSPAIKKLLLGILLNDRRREALQPAFQFLTLNHERTEERGGVQASRDIKLHIDSRDDTIEFLAAMPRVQVAAMLTSKSALLGPLTSLVWSERTKLRTYCIEIVQAGIAEEIVIENAIRVLVFLAEPSTFTLCDPLLNRKDDIRTFAALVPMLLPAFCDRSHYESRILDCNLGLEDRFTALSVLASVGADLGSIYNRLKAIEADPAQFQGWDFLFLMSSVQAPFPEAIPLLEAHLNEKGFPLAIPALMKLGELPVQSATTMLVRALGHADPEIRKTAALSLSQRRSRTALAALIDKYAEEDDEFLAVGLATAIIASGPRSVTDLEARHASPAIQLWRCILAMRLRDAGMADWLVRIAINQHNNWQLRRTAIFAAGRLPYEAALERIVALVMAERSPLTIDRSENRGCHGIISAILLSGTRDLLSIFTRGRAGFIDFFADVFEAAWKDRISTQGLPSGVEAAGWLYDRLAFHGWPARREAPDCVLNELNVPLLQTGVLRSLRLCGRPELIEQQLVTADHIWIAMKCLMERSKTGNVAPEVASRLKDIVEASPYQGNALLHRVIDEIANRPATPKGGRPEAVAYRVVPAPPTHVTYDYAVRALSGVAVNFEAKLTLILEALTEEQCEALIRLADPANDPNRGIETYIPLIKFTADGHVVAQRQVTYKNSGESISALLRPAIAAANKFRLAIPWQQEIMTGVWASGFIPKYLACLGALNDQDRFYEELTEHEDILFPYLCDAGISGSIRSYIDARIVPMLTRYISSGTDDVFEGLCVLALQVNTPEIDPVLSGLLYRWTQRFDTTSLVSQHDMNIPLWRGFDRLTEHARFAMIPEWQSLLSRVMQVPIRWYHAENVVRVLERDPRSYILIESRLFKTENWEHFYHDEIDRLDSAAERLFSQLLED